jgi:archaellum component FlaC
MATRRRSNTSEQTQILRGMWGEMKALNKRIDGTNERLDRVRDELAIRIDGTNARLDETRAELGSRIDALRDETRQRLVETEVRLSTALTDLAHDVQQLTGFMRSRRSEQRTEREELRVRIERLEDHTGIGRPR